MPINDRDTGENPVGSANYYDPVARAKEKQRAREQDEEDLKTGKITRLDLAKHNSFFSSLDFSNAKIKGPR